jgi:hypothetical protein
MSITSMPGMNDKKASPKPTEVAAAQARVVIRPATDFCSDILPPVLYETSNAGLQLRRAISIRAEGKNLLEKHAIAPSAARLCYVAVLRFNLSPTI